MKPKSTKEKDISRLAVYLATYNDSKKIKNSMTEHGIYEFGRRLANLMNIDFRQKGAENENQGDGKIL